MRGNYCWSRVDPIWSLSQLYRRVNTKGLELNMSHLLRTKKHAVADKNIIFYSPCEAIKEIYLALFQLVSKVDAWRWNPFRLHCSCVLKLLQCWNYTYRKVAGLLFLCICCSYSTRYCFTVQWLFRRLFNFCLLDFCADVYRGTLSLLRERKQDSLKQWSFELMHLSTHRHRQREMSAYIYFSSSSKGLTIMK